MEHRAAFRVEMLRDLDPVGRKGLWISIPELRSGFVAIESDTSRKTGGMVNREPLKAVVNLSPP